MKNSLATLADRNKKRAYWKSIIDPSSFPKFKLRVCKACKLEKLCRWNSSFTQTGAPEYRPRCDECFNVRKSNFGKSNRDIVTARALKQRRKRKEKCVKFLGGKCVNCNYSKSIRALTFHHKDPSTKIADVSKLIVLNSWKVVLEELDKCVLLCFNCHMEEEERLDDTKE